MKKDLTKKMRGKYTVSFVPDFILEEFRKKKIFSGETIVDKKKVIGVRKGKNCIAVIYYHVCKDYVLVAFNPLTVESVEVAYRVLLNISEYMYLIESAEKDNKILQVKQIRNGK
ncbi:MAG: hypothetical protein WC389_10955 [Lutibacter sp.]|jgi:hypothetical protein